MFYVCWYRDKDGEKSSNFEGGGRRLRWQNVVLTGVGEVVIGASFIDMGIHSFRFLDRNIY